MGQEASAESGGFPGGGRDPEKGSEKVACAAGDDLNASLYAEHRGIG